MVKLQIGGELESIAQGNIVTRSKYIYDETKGEMQSVINQETDAELVRLDEAKQNNLTFDQTPTENSNNPVTSGGVYAADADLQQSIEAILLLIPSAASALNQLADKAFVNSSVSTATATFRGTYNLVTDLGLTVSATHQQIATALVSVVSTADNNDYCFVQIPVSDQSSDIRVTERYKFDGTAWSYEYDLNNSGFTADQWAAVNSGITSALVSKLGALPTAAELAILFNGKQNTLTFDTTPTSGSNNPVTSGGLYAKFATIDAMIPTGADANNKLVAESRLVAYVTSIIEALDASYNMTTEDGHVTLRLTQVDGAITSLQIATDDIASAIALTALGERVSTNERDIDNLQAAYEALTQSDIVIVNGTLPSSGQLQNVIYRQPDQDHTPPQFYSDYMWNGTTWVLMATYMNAIDPRPKKASQNLVTSGGVFDNMGALDVSELNATENPHTLATYANLAAASAAIPSDYRKGGMSIKFVCSSDNKYVQCRYKGTEVTGTPNPFLRIANWQVIDEMEDTINTIDNEYHNLIVSGNDETVVSKDINTNIGTKYVLYANSWDVSNIASGSTNVLQVATEDYSSTILRITKSQLPSYQFPFIFTALFNQYHFQVRANIGTTADFVIEKYDEYDEKKYNEFSDVKSTVNTIDNEYHRIVVEGNDNTVVSKQVNTNIGEKYVLYANSWNVSNIASDSTNVLQVATGDYSETILKITKAELPTYKFPFIFTASFAKYFLMVRADVSTSVEFIVEKYDEYDEKKYNEFTGVKDKVNTIENEFSDVKSTVNTIDNEYHRIVVEGNDNTVVSKQVNINIGEKYVLYANSWNVSNIASDSTNVLQVATGDYSETILKITKAELPTYKFPFIFTASFAKYFLMVRADVSTSVEFIVEKYDDYDEYKDDKFNAIPQLELCNGLQINLVGNGSTVVTKKISNIEIGKKYILYAPKWSVDELGDSVNVIQFYYFNNSSTILVQQYTKLYLPEIVKIVFTAAVDNYFINMRADLNENVAFFIRQYDNITDESLERLEEDDSSINFWNGKSLAWYGTSIPEGGYPQMIGNYLNATVYNYARGSSATVGGNSYMAYDRNLGHTLAQKVAMVKDTWTIDDVNQTFTNGPRTMGFSDYPNLTTYDQVKAARLSILTASYEVVFLVRTLLSDSTERTAFLQSALGDLYDYMMTNHASSFAYHNIDLWVLDHGHNDNCATNPTNIDMSQVNLTSFVGAMNTYIGLICQYKPHARICIVSDYDDYDAATKKYTIETQKAIAERWHFPFIPIHKYLPFNINTKVRTRGYWDQYATWHDSGFEWGALNGNMIGNGHFNNHIILNMDEAGWPARTIEELEELLNPSQDAAGNWWYDLEPRYIWIYDGLHPHTVAGGKALKMYAEPLSELLKQIGTNGYV